MSKIAQDINVD